MRDSSIQAETSRLLMRNMLEEDAEVFFRLNSNWQNLRYTGDVAFESVEHSRQFLRDYPAYRDLGFGRWTVIRKEDQEILGWCGLKKHPEGFVDLGYRIFEEYWNKGYATEASLAALDFGFNKLGLQEIIGRVARENKGSIRVLEKVGMTFWKAEACEGIEDSLVYRIKSMDYSLLFRSLKNHRDHREIIDK